MVLKINSEIIESINDEVCSEEIKQFLKRCVILEAERYKTEYVRFTQDYDEILDRFIK